MYHMGSDCANCTGLSERMLIVSPSWSAESPFTGPRHLLNHLNRMFPRIENLPINPIARDLLDHAWRSKEISTFDNGLVPPYVESHTSLSTTLDLSSKITLNFTLDTALHLS